MGSIAITMIFLCEKNGEVENKTKRKENIKMNSI